MNTEKIEARLDELPCGILETPPEKTGEYRIDVSFKNNKDILPCSVWWANWQRLICFIANAPQDIRWLLDKVKAVMEIVKHSEKHDTGCQCTHCQIRKLIKGD